jgi:glyoxylase-like metal-dependent hydrolase (beta-lactamase superfamily II)
LEDAGQLDTETPPDTLHPRIVFVGDLIHDDGKLANLYDLQDNFPVAQIGPYHGFMARVPQLITSLEKIRAIQPKSLIPSSDRIIENPSEAIDNLTARLRAVYRNYLSTCALWWYFGEDRMNASAVAILGGDFEPAQLDRMPEAKKYDNPDWLTGFSTTRMIRSETGDVFVMDVNGDREAEQIITMHKNGEINNVKFNGVSGIFITHYHHDHNTGVPKVAKFFSAPVYGTELTADILERPGAYRMPCIQNVEIPVVRKKDGETMKWNEFEFTFFDFPGQTLNHSALLVRKGNERPIFFIGDSFTPTGIDDYCAWNRNLLKEGKGYLYCLEKIRSLDPSPLLVNAHVDPPFEFDAERLDYIERALRERMKLLAELLAVPEINFGLDHAWCRFDPFVAEFKSGEEIALKMVITNHFDVQSEFRIELEPDDKFSFQITPSNTVRELTIEPGAEQSIAWVIKPAKNAKIGILSAKVTSGGTLTGRCEAVMKAIVE